MSVDFSVVTTNTRPERFFSSGSNLRFGGHQSTVTMVFHSLAQSRFFPHFSSTRKNMLVFKPFLQYFATGSGIALCQDYEEYKFVECLSEELNYRLTHTVSYNDISFLNARSQLIWVLASSGFYSITWRMISRSVGYKIHFRKQPPFRGNFVPCRCDIFRFFEFILDPLQFVVHGSRVFIQSNK